MNLAILGALPPLENLPPSLFDDTWQILEDNVDVSFKIANYSYMVKYATKNGAA